MQNTSLDLFALLFDPQYTLVSMLVTMIILAGMVCLIPSNRLDLIRSFGLFATMVPLFWSLYLWALYDASGHTLQFISSLHSLNWLGAPLSFGVDAVSLSLTVLTAALFPICVLLMRNLTGILTFLLLEIVIIGALNVLDLLGFYILFESSLILLFLHIARTPYGSLDAAYKIALYTMAGSLVLLPVIFILYADCGSTNILYIMASQFSETITSDGLIKSMVSTSGDHKDALFSPSTGSPMGYHSQLLLGFGMLAIFAVKIPLIPVHLWLPEAHVAASTSGSILLAGVLLKLGGIGFIRFMIPLLPNFMASIFPLVCCMCLISFIFASLSTIRQIDLKKVVAYSSIAHMSLVTLAIFSGAEYSTASSTFMMIAHGVVSPALFYLVGILYDRSHTKFILYFKGLGATMPLYATFFLLFTMANAAFPLFPNFIAEVLCIVSLFAVHETLAYIFCAAQIFAATYSFWAFNRVVHGIPMGLGGNYTYDLTRQEYCALLPLVIGTFWLGIKPMA